MLRELAYLETAEKHSHRVGARRLWRSSSTAPCMRTLGKRAQVSKFRVLANTGRVREREGR